CLFAGSLGADEIGAYRSLPCSSFGAGPRTSTPVPGASNSVPYTSQPSTAPMQSSSTPASQSHFLRSLSPTGTSPHLQLRTVRLFCSNHLRSHSAFVPSGRTILTRPPVFSLYATAVPVHGSKWCAPASILGSGREDFME